ncbi:hypothetical protein OHB26_05780 [Nocardia sp. NBC_01503]|uniref:hypothetical protein n=1 Tax=Nocardia sp. NBC_01503 TaxID=2975997 RepID=UPI002E7C2039|nr:hypothetical protein [Nocardia sp. NBC_01503]WTL33733.1 hypothetical protein OHB26_05780 [Nocardia sp. NBC_01503]
MLEEGSGAYGPTHRLMVNGREITDVNELSEREYLRLFAKRPGMYIGYESVRGVVSFLNGFDYAARHHGGQGLDGFREWLLTNHVRRESSLAWWALIENIALPDKEFGTKRTPEQEAHVLAVLFDLLDTFLAERETAA